MVGNDETFDLDPPDQKYPHVRQDRRSALIRRNQAANGEAREIVEAAQTLREGFAADVLEQSVEPVRQRRLHLVGEMRRLVIDADVEAELVADIGAFLRAAGNADHLRARDFGELPDDASNSARGGGDDDGFARFRRDDLVQAVPCGDAGHADHAEIGLQRDRLGVDDVEAGAVGHEIWLPAAHADDEIAGLEARIVRLDDFADRPAAHHRPDLLRLGVGFGVAEPAAHVGIEREKMIAYENLARAGLGNGRLDEPEMRGRDLVGRTGIENQLLVDGHGGVLARVAGPGVYPVWRAGGTGGAACERNARISR